MKDTKVKYYLGTIVATAREGHELLKNPPELHEAIIDIPGVIQGILGFPVVGMNDEPRVGDPVLVMSLDPNYGSYYVYQKLKETDFIGFRSSGKMIDITPDNITIGVYDPEDGYSGGNRPDCSALANITVDKSGGITIHAAADIKITADANITINCSGDTNIMVSGNADIQTKNANIQASGNADIQASGNATVKAGGTLETGGGTWKTTNGVAAPTGNGPFCGIPFCAFSGAPQSGQQC